MKLPADDDGEGNPRSDYHLIASGGQDRRADDIPHGRSLLILDDRALDRQCLAYCIAVQNKDFEILSFASIVEWEASQASYPPVAAILLNLGGKRASDPDVISEIRKLCSTLKAPIIVLADSADLHDVLSALECGAKGYIPSSVNIDVCIEAVALSIAGGIFVPASSILAMQQAEAGGSVARPLNGLFTERQVEVVEALRRGKANKIIAFELKLRESTVKVHIRNIMKKLKATNRTEVAYKLKDFSPVTVNQFDLDDE
ncbi:response regulator transcription factor [Rhizobium sp. Leaf262]|uniref:response regulator transcription factor n=1 Tax=Rhizobium sp. Leaf262 TaxID=1736312 RepID=UPI0009E827DB|nr:response regulator transcription factor [Rhizobium sp. Leaf262]